MTQPARLRIAVGLILGVAFLALVGLIIRQSRQLAEYQRQQGRDQQALRELRETLRQHELQKSPAEAEARAPAGDLQAALAKRDKTIEELNRELNDARASIAQFQVQLANTSEEREKALAAANESRQKEQASWQSQIDSLKKEVDSAEAESEASRQRIAALEAENTKLRSSSGEGSARAAEVSRTLSDLQDLDRRRDSYLTSVMRRYRDISGQFHALSGMLDPSRDPSATTPISGAALIRIQNEISLADDDLRQLSELNAQGRQLEKKLVKK